MTEERGKYATEQEDSLNNARAMIGWDRPIEIEDEGDLRKYRIELPNLYDDADLDPYEFRLLTHYKRVGKCTEGTRTTATKCHMSTMAVSEKRKSLHKKGFIHLVIVPLKKGFSYRVTVVDKWQENFLKYSPVRQDYTPVRQVETKKVVVAVDTQNIFTAYQQEIGVLTAFIANDLEDWSKSVSEDWILAAIHESAQQNKRNWKYCMAILKRWKEQGYMDTEKPKEDAYTAALRAQGYDV